MRITMTETRRGSEDGFVIQRFEKDHSYDVADELARSFIRAGWAEEDSLFNCFRSANPMEQLSALSKLPNKHMSGFRVTSKMLEDE